MVGAERSKAASGRRTPKQELAAGDRLMPLVEIRNVTKEYRKGDQKITPLDDVTLDVEKSDFVSLMGASGSGKSTLLNLVAGIDRPTSGRILVNGSDITRLSRTQ